MKKIILMLIVLSLLCLSGCNFGNSKEPSSNDSKPKPAPAVASAVEKMCTIAKGSKPTKTITLVTLDTKAGDKLTGSYSTETDGTDAIFTYKYQRFNTPAESIETGNLDRILTFEGVINYKDGVYFSGDNEEWRPGTGTALDLKLNFDAELFKNAVANEEGTSLEVKFSADELAKFLGTTLNVVGEATVTITHNNVNLSLVTVSCSTENGQMTIRNSYTYNVPDLFPEVEEE